LKIDDLTFKDLEAIVFIRNYKNMKSIRIARDSRLMKQQRL